MVKRAQDGWDEDKEYIEEESPSTQARWSTSREEETGAAVGAKVRICMKYQHSPGSSVTALVAHATPDDCTTCDEAVRSLFATRRGLAVLVT